MTKEADSAVSAKDKRDERIGGEESEVGYLSDLSKVFLWS